MLRLHLAVEAETPKYLAAAANEVSERLRRGERQGEITREDRRAWFKVEEAPREELEHTGALQSEPQPEVTGEVSVDKPISLVPDPPAADEQPLPLDATPMNLQPPAGTLPAAGELPAVEEEEESEEPEP